MDTTVHDVGRSARARALDASGEENTYGAILKSSAFVGGSSALSVCIGIVRAKALAVLLGPAGVGLFGLYGSIADLTCSIAGMGLNSSGVRQIAEAAGSGDRRKIARTAAVLRRTSFVLGVVGAALLIAFSRPVSIATFGTDKFTPGVCIVSIAVLFRLVSDGRTALVQGMRRISDLAKLAVLGALSGTIVTLVLVYFLRENGVVPSLVGVAAMSLAASLWYSRKLRFETPSTTLSQLRREVGALVALGIAFMASGLMMMGSAYIVRITILHKLGIEATGSFQAAWTLAGLYVGFILQAMGADFYPRLTASANDHIACNRMVNEQARVGLLLAGPGVIATLTYAPAVITVFYSARFANAVEVLRWLCIGVTLRVVNWPMGFIILAKGSKSLFFWSELAWTVVYLGLLQLCVSPFGISGAGIAYFGAYLTHGVVVFMIVRRLSGFQWSAQNRQTGAVFLSSIAVVYCGFRVLPFVLAISLGTACFALSTMYSMRVLLPYVNLGGIPWPVGPMLAKAEDLFRDRRTPGRGVR